jgi:hypothetical protein
MATQQRLMFLPFNARRTLEATRHEWFPELADRRIALMWDGGAGPLAVASYRSWLSRIYLHEALNRPDMPLETFQYVLKHELLHFALPPRDGVSHPPEFWERQAAIAPEAKDCDRWLEAHIPALVWLESGRCAVWPRRVRRDRR